MKGLNKRARINVRLLAILAISTGLLGITANIVHDVRKRAIAEKILATGNAAYEIEDWPEAYRQLGLYLSKYPDNATVLRRYATASLAARPIDQQHIAAAIGAYRRLLQHQPGDEQICGRLFRLYARIGDFGEVIYICRQRLKVAPEDADAMLWLARALQHRHKDGEATTILKTLIKGHPEQVEAYALLSGLAMQAESVDSARLALNWLDQCVEHNPHSASAKVFRARMRRLTHGEATSAQADLQTADDLAPTDPMVRLRLAEEWMAWGQLDQAESELQAADHSGERSPTSLDAGSDSLTFIKDSIAARLALLRGDPMAGVELADRAVKELTGAEHLAFSPLAVNLYLAANRLEDARRLVLSFRQSIEGLDNPDPSLIHQANLLDAALADAEHKPYRVISLLAGEAGEHLDATGTWKLLCRAYEQTGQTRRFREATEAHVIRNPTDGQAALILARSLRYEDWEKVETYAEQAEHNLTAAAEARLLRLEAQIETTPATKARAEDADQISEELASLKKSMPRRSDIRLLQARLAEKLGRHKQALGELRTAIRECDDDLPAAMMLVDRLRRAGRWEAGVQVCRQAIERHSQQAKPRIALAELHAAAGRPDIAQKTLAEAVTELKDAQKTEVTYALVRAHLHDNHRPAAIRLLKQLSAAQPTEVRPREWLLDFVEIQEDTQLSEQLVAEIEQIEGKQGLRWRLQQARLWLRGQDWKQRQQEIANNLTQCLATDPRWADPALVLADLYDKLGKQDDVERTYRSALEANPFDIRIADRLLQLLERQRRFVEIQAILDRLRGDSPGIRRYRIRAAIGRRAFETALSELESVAAEDPTDIDSRILAAKIAYGATHQADRALAYLDEAEAIQPTHAEISRLKAGILRAAGRPDEALGVLNDALRRSADFDSYKNRAELYAVSGQLERAEEDYKHLRSFKQSGAQGYHLLGSFYLQSGRQEEAIATWKAGLKVDPADNDLRIDLIRTLTDSTVESWNASGRAMLNQLLAERPDNPELLVILAGLRLAENKDDAIIDAKAILSRAIHQDVHAVSAYLELIKLALGEQDFEEAERWIHRALAANPDNPALLLAEAESKREAGQMKVARQQVTDVLDLDPMNPGALNLMAQLEIDAGNINEAIAYHERVKRITPNDPVVYLMDSLIQEKQGRRDSAIRILKSYLTNNTDRRRIAALLALVDLYLKNNDFPAARRKLQDAESLLPDNRQVRMLRLRLLFGEKNFDAIARLVDDPHVRNHRDITFLSTAAQMLASSNQPADRKTARRLLEQMLKNCCDSAKNAYGLARVAVQMKEFDVAQRAYRRVLDLDPNNRQTLNDLAWILCEYKSNAKAGLSLAQKGLDLYPNDIHLLDTRAVALIRLGRFEDARTDLQQCLKLADGVPGTQASALLHMGRAWLEQQNREKARSCLHAAKKLIDQLPAFPQTARREVDDLLNTIDQ